jgi:Domain of unknown function (DUF4437)
MVKVRFLTLALVACAATVVGAQTAPPKSQAEKPKATAAAAPAQHVVVEPDAIKWGPGPASLPPGAEMAVLDGDPSKAVPFVIRAKLPDGYRVAPHFHPTAENVSVLSGTFLVGMGDTFAESSMKTLGSGGFAKMPKGMHHYAMTKGETVIQVHGIGPFAITYVNPNDDPRSKAKTSTK